MAETPATPPAPETAAPAAPAPTGAPEPSVAAAASPAETAAPAQEAAAPAEPVIESRNKAALGPAEAPTARARFVESLSGARATLGRAKDAVLGKDTVTGEIGNVAQAAKEVAVGVPGAQLKALGKLVTLHPIQAVQAEAAGLKKAVKDTASLGVATLRGSAKSVGATVASPFKAVALAGSLASGAVQATGRGIASTGSAILHSPFRVWNAITNGLVRLHDAIVAPLLSGGSVAIEPKAEPA